MPKLKASLYCVLIFVIIILLANTIFTQFICRIDFMILHQDFLDVAEELSRKEISFASIEKRRVSQCNGTIDETLFIESFTQRSSVKKLFYSGYETIEKTQNGIYFIKQYGLTRIKAIMYYPNGFSPEYNGLVTRYTKIEEGWYYSEQR